MAGKHLIFLLSCYFVGTSSTCVIRIVCRTGRDWTENEVKLIPKLVDPGTVLKFRPAIPNKLGSGQLSQKLYVCYQPDEMEFKPTSGQDEQGGAHVYLVKADENLILKGFVKPGHPFTKSKFNTLGFKPAHGNIYLIAFDHENELVYSYNETLGHIEIYMENGTHVATKAKLNQKAKWNQTLLVMRLDLKNRILYWLAKESRTSEKIAVYECRLTEESWIEPLNISGFYYDLTIDSEGVLYLVGREIVRIRRINDQSYKTEHITADNFPHSFMDIDDNGLLYYQRRDGSITSVDTNRNGQHATPVTYYNGKTVDCIRVYGGVLYWYIPEDGIIYTKSLDNSTNDGQMELTPGENIVFYIIPVS